MEEQIKKDELGDKSHGGLGKYDPKGNSATYQKQFIEFIYDIEVSMGTVIAFVTCEANVKKYRGRAMNKLGVSLEADFSKVQWYEKMSSHFKAKIIAEKEGEKLEFANRYIPITEPVRDLINIDFEKYSAEPYKRLADILETL